jgi:hypothetical protein
MDCQHTEEEPGTHWATDIHGDEYRIDCGCPCPQCEEY